MYLPKGILDDIRFLKSTERNKIKVLLRSEYICAII